MQSDLKLDIIKETDKTIIRIDGEIDIFSVGEFKGKTYDIMQEGCQNVIFDCEKLKYIDSTGLGVFVSFLKKSKQHGCGMKLVSVKGNIMKLFSITGLDRILDIEKGVI